MHETNNVDLVDDLKSWHQAEGKDKAAAIQMTNDLMQINGPNLNLANIPEKDQKTVLDIVNEWNENQNQKCK